MVGRRWRRKSCSTFLFVYKTNCSAVRDFVQRVNTTDVKKFEMVYSVDAIIKHIDEFDLVFNIDDELIA